LATSDSNIAVDNLLEGLINAGVRAVRLGRPDAVRPDLLQHSVDWSSTADDSYDERQRKIRSAEVVCATCIGAGSDALERFKFPAVLIDEATQATEGATLVPICRGARQLVLLGDQCQLPPTTLSNHPLAAGTPLFTRLASEGAPVRTAAARTTLVRLGDGLTCGGGRPPAGASA
jgi:superfamily I DNA and/or RNA helicase